MTYNAEKSVKPSDLVPEGDKPIAIVVGAIAVGSVSMTVRTWLFITTIIAGISSCK